MVLQKLENVQSFWKLTSQKRVDFSGSPFSISISMVLKLVSQVVYFTFLIYRIKEIIPLEDE